MFRRHAASEQSDHSPVRTVSTVVSCFQHSTTVLRSPLPSQHCGLLLPALDHSVEKLTSQRCGPVSAAVSCFQHSITVLRRPTSQHCGLVLPALDHSAEKKPTQSALWSRASSTRPHQCSETPPVSTVLSALVLEAQSALWSRAGSTQPQC